MDNPSAETPGGGRSFEDIKADLSNKILETKTPSDFILTLMYAIPILAPITVCLEAGIFTTLAQANRPSPLEDLVPAASSRDGTNRHAQLDFLHRNLRATASIALIDEPSPRTYVANALTHQLADPGIAAGFRFFFDNVMGPRSTMTEFVADHKARNWTATETATDGPFQRARDIAGTSTFAHWQKQDPEQLARLSSLMQTMQGRATGHWTEWFPAAALFRRDPPEAAKDADGDGGAKPMFVDVGGGLGHDIAALARKYPDADVRLVVQDLPSVIARGETSASRKAGGPLDPQDRIAWAEHDFFAPQPEKHRGAWIYYMHKILHDWPDGDCVRILGHLRDAMGRASRVLVNDVILPGRGASVLHSAFDIDMLALHSGKERDEASWRRLVDQVSGLEVRKFWHPPNGEGEGIVEIGRTEY